MGRSSWSRADVHAPPPVGASAAPPSVPPPSPGGVPVTVAVLELLHAAKVKPTSKREKRFIMFLSRLENGRSQRSAVRFSRSLHGLHAHHDCARRLRGRPFEAREPDEELRVAI